MATVVKLSWNGEIRRFSIESQLFTLETLTEKTKELYSNLKSCGKIEFSWLDDENDHVAISSTEELFEAIRVMKGSKTGYLKFDISTPGLGIMHNSIMSSNHSLFSYSLAPPTPPQNNNTDAKLSFDDIVVHSGVRCDECGVMPIVGVRYKCTFRHDYDLCESCEKKTVQPFPMTKLYKPQATYLELTESLFGPNTSQSNSRAKPMTDSFERESGRKYDRYCSMGQIRPKWRDFKRSARNVIVEASGYLVPNKRCPGLGDEHDINVEVSFDGSVSDSFKSDSSAKSRNQVPKTANNLRARYVHDVTYPDGSKLQPGTAFVKTWKVRNDGSVDWPEGCVLVHAGGDFLSPFGESLKVPVPSVKFGVDENISIELVAPIADGRHVEYFRFQNAAGSNFGQRLWADIRVVEDIGSWEVVSRNENDEEEEIITLGIHDELISQEQSNIVEGIQQLELEDTKDGPVIEPSPSRESVWSEEIQIFASMGFDNLEVLIPLFEEHLKEPKSKTGELNQEGMQAVAATVFGV